MNYEELVYSLDWYKEYGVAVIDIETAYVDFNNVRFTPFEHAFARKFQRLNFSLALFERDIKIPEWLTLLEKAHFIYGDIILEQPGIVYNNALDYNNPVIPSLDKKFTEDLDFKVREKVHNTMEDKRTPVLIRRKPWEFMKDQDEDLQYCDAYYVYGRFTTGVI